MQPPPGYPPPPYGQPPYPQHPQGGYPQGGFPGGYPPPPPPQSSGTNPVVIILAVVGAVIVLGIGACIVCVGVGAGVVAESEHRAKEERKVAKAETTNVDLVRLLGAYRNNEVAADAQYKGKYVRVTGVAREIKKDFTDDAYVEVSSKVDGFEVPSVHCDFGAGTKTKEASIAQIQRGATITVVGRVDGLMMDVLLNDCEVSEPTK